MSKVWATIEHEFWEVLPPTIFFFVSFHIVLLDRALMAKEYGFKAASMAAATVAALLVAKVVLIADKLPMINRFPEKPLMYDVVWKTVIYVAASLLLHYLEHLLPTWWRMGSFGAANEHLASKIVSAALLGDPALADRPDLRLLLTARARTRIGRHRVHEIYFGSPAMR